MKIDETGAGCFSNLSRAAASKSGVSKPNTMALPRSPR